MCGIYGFTGRHNALPRLIEGLGALEYRGYDSAGVAYFKDKKIKVVKTAGRISALAALLPEDKSFCGIGHTRWATHGEPSDRNSHPHGTDRVSIVHNGIIENYAELREELTADGYNFSSDTDTEAAALLIDKFFKETGSPVAALAKAAARLRGSYAIAAVFEGFEGSVFGIKRGNPLLIAVAKDGHYITSDIAAVLQRTNRYITLSDGEITEVNRECVLIYDEKLNRVERSADIADWDRSAAEKGGFAHFMLKEIHEEPDSVIKTVTPHIKGGIPSFVTSLLSSEAIEGYSHIHIVACGTAYHAGLVGAFLIERLARTRVSVHLASEFRYNEPIIGETELVIAISQSGETADTLAAVRLAKTAGASVLGILNARGSSIERESDGVIFTLCGPEIAVASTKAFTSQVALLSLVAIHIALSKSRISRLLATELSAEISSAAPKKILAVLSQKEVFSTLAERIKTSKSIFYIGRGIDAVVSQEAALKAKEISYIHCESYAAGELKHGTISLVTEGVPVIALVTNPVTAEKTVSNIREVLSRGADVTVLAAEGIVLPEDFEGFTVRLPDTNPLLSPLVLGSAVQLLAYYLSLHLGLDVDKPRNLAKSVTVE